jgi:hypothetical protein
MCAINTATGKPYSSMHIRDLYTSDSFHGGRNAKRIDELITMKFSLHTVLPAF